MADRVDRRRPSKAAERAEAARLYGSTAALVELDRRVDEVQRMSPQDWADRGQALVAECLDRAQSLIADCTADELSQVATRVSNVTEKMVKLAATTKRAEVQEADLEEQMQDLRARAQKKMRLVRGA